MAVITISRQFGSGGEFIAREISRNLDYLLVNKAMISERLKEFVVSEPELTIFDEKKIVNSEEYSSINEAEERVKFSRYLENLQNFFYDLAIRENLVILGRGGQVLFKDFPPAVHVKVVAPLKNRIERVCKQHNLDEAAAARLIAEQDEDRREYLRFFFGHDWLNLDLYHLVINTGLIDLDECVSLITNAAHFKESADRFNVQILEEASNGETGLEPLQDASGTSPMFAHPSEEEFARMLDFYRIEWLYEPKTFPLEWDSEGNISEAFSPDFYLPEQDLFVELTTQKQKLVWKKNKKIRRLKELYPDVNIKIIYGRDYRGLLYKYGIDEKGPEDG